MSEYVPESISALGRVNVGFHLSNHSTKADLKDATSVGTLNFFKNVDLAILKSNIDKLDIGKLKNVQINLNNLKSKVDKLDVDKLVPVPVDLSKLSDVVKNDVVEKDVYNAKIKNIEDEIPDITNLAANTTINAKMNEAKNKTPSITNLATTTALTAVENKIPNVTYLVKKKPDYITKISEFKNNITTDHVHDKYITTQEFNKLTAENFTARLAQANLTGISNFVKKTDLNELPKRIKTISTKGLTKDLINKFINLNRAKYFSSFISQNYLVFIPTKTYIKYFSGTTRIDSWKSNGISEENTENITKTDCNLLHAKCIFKKFKHRFYIK